MGHDRNDGQHESVGKAIDKIVLKDFDNWTAIIAAVIEADLLKDFLLQNSEYYNKYILEKATELTHDQLVQMLDWGVFDEHGDCGWALFERMHILKRCGLSAAIYSDVVNAFLTKQEGLHRSGADLETYDKYFKLQGLVEPEVLKTLNGFIMRILKDDLKKVETPEQACALLDRLRCRANGNEYGQHAAKQLYQRLTGWMSPQAISPDLFWKLYLSLVRLGSWIEDEEVYNDWMRWVMSLQQHNELSAKGLPALACTHIGEERVDTDESTGKLLMAQLPLPTSLSGYSDAMATCGYNPVRGSLVNQSFVSMLGLLQYNCRINEDDADLPLSQFLKEHRDKEISSLTTSQKNHLANRVKELMRDVAEFNQFIDGLAFNPSMLAVCFDCEEQAHPAAAPTPADNSPPPSQPPRKSLLAWFFTRRSSTASPAAAPTPAAPDEDRWAGKSKYWVERLINNVEDFHEHYLYRKRYATRNIYNDLYLKFTLSPLDCLRQLCVKPLAPKEKEEVLRILGELKGDGVFIPNNDLAINKFLDSLTKADITHVMIYSNPSHSIPWDFDFNCSKKCDLIEWMMEIGRDPQKHKLAGQKECLQPKGLSEGESLNLQKLQDTLRGRTACALPTREPSEARQAVAHPAAQAASDASSLSGWALRLLSDANLTVQGGAGGRAALVEPHDVATRRPFG